MRAGGIEQSLWQCCIKQTDESGGGVGGLLCGRGRGLSREEVTGCRRERRDGGTEGGGGGGEVEQGEADRSVCVCVCVRLRARLSVGVCACVLS